MQAVIYEAINQPRLEGRHSAKRIRVGDQMVQTIHRLAPLQGQRQLLAKIGHLDARRAQVATMKEKGYTTVGEPQHDIGRKADALDVCDRGDIFEQHALGNQLWKAGVGR